MIDKSSRLPRDNLRPLPRFPSQFLNSADESRNKIQIQAKQQIDRSIDLRILSTYRNQSKGSEIRGDEPIRAGLHDGVEIDSVGRIGGGVDRKREDSERKEHENNEGEHEKHRENESAGGRS